jgi:hypothetical protein
MVSIWIGELSTVATGHAALRAARELWVNVQALAACRLSGVSFIQCGGDSFQIVVEKVGVVVERHGG